MVKKKELNILIACEKSGLIRDAMIEQGHNAVSCDLKPTDRPGPHYQGDVRDVLNDVWDMMIAHPVCRRLANSGVRWLHVPPPGKTLAEMWEEFEEAVAFYLLLRNAKIKYKAIENPIMHCYAKERIQPGKRHIVQPFWFGDKAFKATGFELINLPPLRATNMLIPPKPGTQEHKAWSFIHRMPPSADREDKRSETFPGMAKAIAQQWGNLKYSNH